MPLDDARNFVFKMKENREFRQKILQAKNPEDLASFLREERLVFDQRELVGAMAECMAQLEQMGS
ncbi:MAG: Nif11-like leader peptide family natural product precursor [Syntrophales bacterium]